jgi:hypothetical protein
MKHPFNLGVEHLPFPNGGGLKAAMASRAPKSQSLEVEALKKKHEVELQKLREKHSSANKPRAVKPMRRNQGR